MRKVIVVDFSGTLIKPFVAEKANQIRYKRLGIQLPSLTQQKRDHATKHHYDVLKAFIAKKFGITDLMKIILLQRDGKELLLSGKDVTTLIMTDMFRDCMYEVAQRH